MTFLTPLLTAGAALVAVPIVLHLVMRQRPRQLMFPALRFVRNRRSMNQTRMRLRHLILLALRCAAIALLALALARPILQPEGTTGGAGSGGSVAIVIDNSLRMGYRSDNQTHLDAAKRKADWLLGQLPHDTQVIVADLASRSVGRLVDRDAARARLSRARLATRSVTIDQAVRGALAALAESNSQKQDLFLLTDQTQGAMPDATLDSLDQALGEFPKATLYLVDVGADMPRNLGVISLKPSAETLAVGQTLRIDATLSVTGPAPNAPVSVELWLDSQRGPEKRGEQLVEAKPGEQPVEFSIAGLPEGVHQGYVRVLGNDPLPEDNTRWFSVRVEPARRVLLVAGGQKSALFVKEALAPSAATGAQVYQVNVARFGDRWDTRLGEYEAVFLLDPPEIGAAQWRALAGNVSRGGSAAIALGRRATLDAFNSPDAQLLLPGELRWKSRDQTYLRPRAYNHPAITPLAEFAESIPWSAFPVFAYWSLDKVEPTAVTVARYANDEPAILEQQIDAGHVLLVTTSFSDSASNDPWNLLPTGIDPWPFLALVDSLGGYLCGATEAHRNYTPGETAVVPLGDASAGGYVVRMPTGDAIRQTLPTGQTEATIGMTDELGNYRVQSGGEGRGVDDGFSVSPPESTSRLHRVPHSKITDKLPANRVRFAADQQDLLAQIDVGGAGSELYPWLITLVALSVAAESWVSNRFYEGSGEREEGRGLNN